MKEFLLIFRNNNNPGEAPSPEQMQGMMQQWQDWIGSIAAQNKLANSGNRLSMENSRVVKPNKVITNGPYVEISEAINGYIIVNATSVDEAAEIAKGCPVLLMGGNVEVRTVVPMDNNN